MYPDDYNKTTLKKKFPKIESEKENYGRMTCTFFQQT